MIIHMCSCNHIPAARCTVLPVHPACVCRSTQPCSDKSDGCSGKVVEGVVSDILASDGDKILLSRSNIAS